MTGVAELIDELAALGIELWEEGGELRFRAPRGALTEDRRGVLRGRRDDLLAYLRGVGSVVAVPEESSRHDPFPLTDIQAAYVLGRRSAFAYGGVGCHAYGELVYTDLDGERVAEVWRRLVDRHDMLRAVIDPGGSQRVLEQAPRLDVAVADLRGSGEERAASEIAATRAELDHRIYDPGVWPLFEVRVTRTDTRAVLHLSIDFLVADFVSIRILLDEFHQLYHERGSPLAPLDITFRDYLLAERRLRGTRQYRDDRAYWWERIDTLPPAPDLPLAGARSNPGQVRFRRHTLELSDERYGRFRALAAEHDVTPSAALLAAYAEVVGRWSRRRRYSLNLTLLGRLPLHPQVDALVGDFTSVVVLEVDAGAAPSFTARAQRLQQRLWEDMDHRLVGGVEVLREVARRRGQGAALMPVVFTSALGLGKVAGQGADAARVDHGISQTPQVWIDCQALEHGDGLTLNWDVRDAVFPPGLVEDAFERFSALVRDLADGKLWDAEQCVALPDRQRDSRLRFNDTRGPEPAGLLHDGVVAQCLRTPDRPAVVAASGCLRYGELLDRARRVATAVRDAGCVPGDIAAIVLDADLDQIVAVLGVLLAGCVYLPVDTRQPPARRERLITDAGARLAIAGSPAEAPGATAHLAIDRLGAGTAPISLERRAGPADLAYVIHTSGSTGRPKGVMIPHRGARNTVEDCNRRFGVGPDDRVLGLASLAFDLSVYDIFGPLAVGGALVLPSPDRRGDPSHWSDLVATHGVTVWNSVPAQMQMLHDYLAVAGEVDLPTLRLAMLSGDWIPVRLPDQVRSRLPGVELISLGGATEASIWSIFYPIGDVPREWASIPYGRPMTNQTFHVLDELGRGCPDWTVGELVIGGAGVATGYLGDPEQTAKRFVQAPATGEARYRTGDLGRFLPEGVIEFLGREDLQVKIRGHRIELAEIEACLSEDPAVGAAAVIVEGDGALDRKLVGFVEPASRDAAGSGQDPLADALRGAAGRELAAGERAGRQAVVFAEQLDRTALLAMASALREQGLFPTPDASSTVADVLRVARVSPKHHRLIRRWLQALERNGLLARDAVTGKLSGLPAVDRADVEDAWRRADELSREWGERTELIEYFRVASRQLPELMRDETDPVRLLFPEGRVDIQESAYQGNFLSSTLNRLVVAAVRGIAEHHGGGLRLLEVGAGVGGASIDLIPALAACDMEEYLFTDVSQFFLNGAKARFADYEWVDYGLFDLNLDYREQGLSSNSYDVVLCANVLHYARHAGQAIARLRELLRPGGWLVFIETTRDNYQILTSMEFLFDATAGDFEDVRAGRDETFIAVEEWHDLLAGAGADPALRLSEGDAALTAIGMHVFAARFKRTQAAIDAGKLRARLASLLPEYMIPSRVEVLDTLPLTDNDKVDRKALAALAPVGQGAKRAAAGEGPSGPLEAALAALWGEVLGAGHVGRGDTIFELGGDSLLAAQLVGRMREKVPEAAGASFDQLLRDLLEGATVATTAATLDRAGERTEDSEQAALFVVADQAGQGFQLLLPDGTGGVGSVAHRARTQGKVRGVRLLESERFLALDARSVLEVEAARCTGLVTAEAEGDGFVALLGQDFGGLLAFELARQLAETGHAVHDLTVVASSSTIPGEVGAPELAEAFARALGVAPAEVGLAGEHDATAGPWLARLAEALDDEPDALERRLEVFRHSADAQRQYRLGSYVGDLTLVLAYDTRRWPDATERLVAGWRDACFGEVRVREEPAGGTP